MICPKCQVQMHQKDRLGGGTSNDNKYETWEIKECPQCGRLVKEYYSCEVINLSKLAKIQSQQPQDIIVEAVHE